MAHTIQMRRDTAANWTTTNPVLAQGELGYETDVHKYKVGDGVTTWNNITEYYSNTSDNSYMSGGILFETLTNIGQGWHPFYTVPSGKKYLLNGMWANRGSGTFTLLFLGIADLANHEYILWSETKTDITCANVTLGEPIMLYEGWTLKFYKLGTAVGSGECGAYGIETDA